jgi:uridine kinase
LLQEVLVPLRGKGVARYARYDWPTDSHAEIHEVSPQGIVVIEGATACRNELREFYDVRIWVECSRSERLRRGIARDGESARMRWETDWMPAEDCYVKTHDPATYADIRVRGETS